jgi:hypothetical protein
LIRRKATKGREEVNLKDPAYLTLKNVKTKKSNMHNILNDPTNNFALFNKTVNPESGTPSARATPAPKSDEGDKTELAYIKIAPSQGVVF